MLGQQQASLRFIQSTPDAVGFTDLDGVVETCGAHSAVHADLLGPSLAAEFVLLALELRGREEHCGMRSTTRGPQLPVLLDLLCDPLSTHDGTAPSPREERSVSDGTPQDENVTDVADI